MANIERWSKKLEVFGKDCSEYFCNGKQYKHDNWEKRFSGDADDNEHSLNSIALLPLYSVLLMAK
jgi:hypothetical protein